MKEVLITSSALIMVIVLLRTLLKGKISLRLQYALWLLVALRLLIPVSFFQSPVSVLNVVEPVRSAISAAAPKTPSLPGTTGNTPSVQGVPGGTTSAGGAVTVPDGSAPAAPERKGLDMTALLPGVWLAGVAVMGVWFLLSDLLFRRKLGRSAKRLRGLDCPLPVRMTAAVPSPCLYGIFRPAIYLTPNCLENEGALRHVLAHEEIHYRHLDHIWSMVRCVCLAIYWFNPLVWLAAALSRRDCELACDEGAIRRLGESERLSYGRTLLSMVVPKSAPADLLRTATTMTSGKGGLKERIGLIAKRPKAAAVTVIAVVLIAAVAVGCTFTGAKESKAPDLPLEEALTVLPDELKDSVVLKEDGEVHAGELLATYYYQEDVDAGHDGWMCGIARLTPVEFEQGYYGFDMTGGASYLGRDGEWYYVLYSPTDVRTAHYETYRPAVETLRKWVEETFARYEDVKPMEEDAVYRALSGAYSYDSPHINVIYHPYYGLTNYGAERTDTAYTLVLSQPAKQGEGGIWCVDRWYDGSGTAYMWIPETDMTLEAYYADLQVRADKGEADWALEPLELCVKYAKEQFGHDRTPEAFAVSSVYEGEPQIVSTAVTVNEGVARRLGGLANADGAVLLRYIPYEGKDAAATEYPAYFSGQDGAPFLEALIDNYTWSDVQEQAYFNDGSLEPEQYAYTITVSNSVTGQYFRFFEGSNFVLYHNKKSGDAWYEAASSLDVQPVGTVVRGWFDRAEYTAKYEPLYIEEAKATLLLPKSWAGNYVVERKSGRSGFYLVQKDFLSGEWGIREDGTEGPVPFGDGGFVSLIGFDVQKKEDYLATFGSIGGHNGLWLGEKDGLYYLIWFPTSFSHGDTVDAQAKAELYNKLMDDIQAYPSDSSAYFIFDP